MSHGVAGEMPVLAIASATLPRERHLVSRLDAIAQDAAEAGLVAPVVFIIGRVVDAYRPWSAAWMTALESRDQAACIAVASALLLLGRPRSPASCRRAGPPSSRIWS